MYSDSDIDDAVAAGAISAEAAAALRAHVARSRSLPAVDEEQFRLLTGFNDIFVSIAIVLLLAAVGGLADMVNRGVGGVAVAAMAWGLAEYFTRRRRMALPSIVLLLAFVAGVARAAAAWILDAGLEAIATTPELASGAVLVALFTAAAVYLHWRRFRVPITVAAVSAALVAAAMASVLALAPQSREYLLLMLFAAGLAVFGFAMCWDMSDRARQTRRSDVAFWLHLLAAPMVAHPVFLLTGLWGPGSVGHAAAALLLYVLFALVALAVDRRAILVSGLAYVLFAISMLLERAGAVGVNIALTGIVIGSALLVLSAFWHPTRRRLVACLPGALQGRLPVTT